MKKLLSLFTALVLMGGMMTVQAVDYYLAGTFNGWNTTNDANLMSLESGTIYSKTISGLGATDYKFKVSTYNWGSDWGSGTIDNSQSNVTLGGTNDITFTLDAVSDVTFYFDAGETKKIYVQATPASNPPASFTIPAGTVVYYDFKAYGSGINVYAPGSPTDWYASSAEVISVTLSSDWVISASTNLFKSAASNWSFVTGTILPTDGQNMIVSTDGVNYSWGTYVPSSDPGQVTSYTFPANTVVYYDFKAYGSGINVYAPGSPSDWYASSAEVISVTLSSDWVISASTNLFKSAASNWSFVTGNVLPTDGQNMIVSTDGVNYSWGTYVPSSDPGQDPGQDPDPAQVTWTVAGDNGDVFGTTWDAANAANDMTLVGEDYTWSKEDVTLGKGTLLFKVCKNHDWAEAYPSANYELSIPEDGIYDISITFNEDSKEVNATATKKGSAVVIPTIAMHGDFLGSWANTANFEIAEGNEKASLTLNITSTGIKSFGMRIGGSGNWTSNGSQFTRNDSIKVIVSGSGDCSLDVDVAGDYVFTWTYATNTLTVTYPEIPEPDAFVAGSSAEIFGAEWDGSAAANKMIWDEGLSKYTKTYTVDKAYKSVALKVVYNGVWYGVEGGEDNVKFSLSGAGEFTVLFDKTSHFVTLDGAIVGEELFDFAHVAVAGNGSTGSNWLNGENWNAAAEANRMNEVATDIYEISFSDVEGVQCQFQFTFDDAWIYQFGGTFSNFGSETAAVYGNGGGNITFTPVAGAKITIRLDLSNFNFATKEGATFTVSQVEPAPTFVTVRTGLEIGRYYTVCLEKNVVEVQGATFWSLTYRNEGGTMAYIEEEAVPFAAGKPFIFQATADKLDVLYGDETAAEPVENGALRGTFEYMSIADVDGLPGNPYLLIQNALRPRLLMQNSLGDHRAYVEYNALSVGAPVSAPGRRVRSMPMQPNTATGIGEVPSDKVQSTKVLIDGQLYLLRGEKLYDATGRLVK